MAASPLIPTVPNTPLSTRHANDDDPIENIRLPSGACNYTNLNVAGSGPKCGCRRFFDKGWGTSVTLGDGASSAGNGTSGFCMCEHHSCFHDHGPEEGPRGRPQGSPALQRSSVSHRQTRTQVSSSADQVRHSARLGKGPELGRPYEPSLPDTLQWGRYVHSGSSAGSLPAIPSQCLLPSDNDSGSSGSQAFASKPFAGLGLNTFSHLPMSKPVAGIHNIMATDNGRLPVENPRPKQVYVDSSGRQFLQSLTEVATPRSSQATAVEEIFNKNIAGINNALNKLEPGKIQAAEGTVAIRAHSTEDPSHTMPNSTADTDETMEPSLLPRLRSVINHVAHYPITMQNHEQRITLLEDGSFHNGAIEEVQEMHEHLDTRVVDLESRVEEVEKMQAAINDVSSIGSRPHADGSFESRVSNTSSALISAAIDRLDPSRVQALEAQVAELQASALPTHSRPWEVEVVFIPYGRRLMGIWASRSTMTQRSRGNSMGTMDWTHTQNNSLAAAQASLVHKGPDASWEGAALILGSKDQDAWLSARACGLRSKVDERLRSRGLVKMIQIKGPDARDIQAAIMCEFAELPITLAQDPFANDGKMPARVPEDLQQYLGLQASWIPLRKIHKDSCLRFLTPAEMVTPALWTVPFLSSSVAMRSSGIRRLYVTQPDSYMQHFTDAADWTWQTLRQLPRVYPEGQSFGHTPEADAQEPCWEFDARLDQLPSVHASFESHHSMSIRSIPHEVVAEPSSPSDHFSSAAVSPNPSTNPNSVAALGNQSSSSLRDRQPFRPIRARTTSAPSLISLKPSHSHSQSQISKRRQASNSPFPIHQDTQSSPILGSTTITLKRRRTRSPSRPRDTPRWSVGPPSPYTFMDEGIERERGGNGKRPTTPFAYATPHSNATYYGFGDGGGSSRPRSGGDLTDDNHTIIPGGGASNISADVIRGLEYDSYDEASTDVRQGEQASGDEWHGVEDEERVPLSLSMGKKSVDDGRRYVDETMGGVDDDEGGKSESERSFGSGPSEYPSTQQQLGQKQPEGFKKTTGSPFRIHVDEGEED